MDKKKSYLVYDGEDAPEEVGTLRDRFDEDTIDEPVEEKAPEKSKKVKKEKQPSDKPKPKKTKKAIERVLVIMIAILLLAIAGIVGIYFTGGEDGIINNSTEQIGRISITASTSDMTAKKMFSFISKQNSTKPIHPD